MKKLAEMGLAKIGVAAGVGYFAGKQMRAGRAALGLSDFDSDQEALYKEVLLIAENDGDAYRERSPSKAVDSAIALVKRQRREVINWDSAAIRTAAIRELQASWQSHGRSARGRRAGSKKWDWQKNIFTGDYITNVDDHVQLLRMAGLEPPYLYWARERSGGREALTGPVESTPAKAVASLRRMMKEFGRARSKQMTKRQSFIVAEIVRESPPYLASDAVARYKAAIARGEGWIETSDALGVADDFIRKAGNAAGWKKAQGRSARGRRAGSKRINGAGDIPNAWGYVTATDTFMSGWGQAEGKKNKVILPVKNFREAEIVAQNARNRSDMKYVSIRQSKPSVTGRGVLWSLMNRDDAKPWYKRGGFQP